jgi:MFS family permease
MSVTDQTSDRSGGWSSGRSLIPARLDGMRWSRFHTRVIVALGIAWIIDGLEIQIASLSTSYITKPASLGLSSSSVAFSVGTIYLLGEVAGSLVFGNLSDRWGRKNLFMITLGVYLLGGVLTACTAGKGEGWVIFLDFTRFLAGFGIGGEYAAINSAIDEIIPSRYRGRVDIGINGTYWGGALIATILSLLIVQHLPVSWNWRLAFLFGPILGVCILLIRRNLPESPRWLLMHGRTEQAEAETRRIEEFVVASGGEVADVDESYATEVQQAGDLGVVGLARVLFSTYPSRSVLGASLMICQSFLYNAIFFTYALVLTKVYGVSSGDTSYYFMVFAAGNLLGPLFLGHLFDSVGRRKMIAGTYLLSGVLLIISASLFKAGALNATTQTLCWCIIFFFASAGASAAYLTVSEIFPVEVRAKAIAVFFCIAQSFGALGPWLYGKMIGNGKDHTALFIAYLIGAVVMLIGGLVEAFIGVDAEGRSLENISSLTAVDQPSRTLSAPTGAPRAPTARSVLDAPSRRPAGPEAVDQRHPEPGGDH